MFGTTVRAPSELEEETLIKRIIAALLCACLFVQVAAPAAHASVNVERQGDENPVKEVAKSIIYGGLAGLLVGGAAAWATDGNDNDEEIVRWGFVGGVAVGLGVGLWWVTRRPQPTAALELKDGTLRAQMPMPELGSDGRPRLTLARVKF